LFYYLYIRKVIVEFQKENFEHYLWRIGRSSSYFGIKVPRFFLNKREVNLLLDLEEFMLFRQKVLFNKGIEEVNLRVTF